MRSAEAGCVAFSAQALFARQLVDESQKVVRRLRRTAPPSRLVAGSASGSSAGEPGHHHRRAKRHFRPRIALGITVWFRRA